MQKKIIIAIIVLLLVVLAKFSGDDKTAKNPQTNDVLDEMILNEKIGEYESLKDGNLSQSEQINNDVDNNSTVSERTSSGKKEEMENENDIIVDNQECE